MKKVAFMFAALCLSACTIEATSSEGHSCEDVECSGGLFCNPDKICVSMQLGESCKNYRCGDGLICNEKTKECEEIQAKVKEGGTCESVHDCENGLFCNPDKICVSMKLGESCKNYNCGDGLICSENKICEAEGSEIPKAKEGESCANVDCDTDLKCNSDGICVKESEVPKAKKGESCVNVECDTDLKCIDTVCIAVISEVPKAKKGESCVNVECDTDLKCNSDGICEETADDKGKAGENCGKNEDCDTGLFCNHDNKCSNPLSKGEKCDINSLCEPGLQCDGFEHKCLKAKLGDACDIADCDDGLVCMNKICIEKPKGLAGDHCESDEDCENGLLCEDHEGNKICTKPASEGECLSNSDCKNPEKPICGDDYKCVAAPADLCDGKCTKDAECVLGICVTEEMKALQNGDNYPSGAADSFCNGSSVVYKDSNNKAVLFNCASGGYSGCVV